MLFKEREAKYLPILTKAFEVLGLPPALGPAIARQESGFIADIENLGPGDKERGGSYGLCQMSLKTAQSLGFIGTVEELKDPQINASLAADLCLHNLQKLQDHSNLQNVIRDLAAMYNSGKVFDKAPRITQMQYVPNVLKYYQQYSAVVFI